jgi:5-methylthioadenosine/S-adenosylhomocysteine deaminase
LGGAKALGLEARIGSITAGKAADLAAVRVSGPEMSPCYDPLSQLVYAAGREQVSDVWIAGKHLMQDGIVEALALWTLDTRAKLWQNSLRSLADC